MGRERVVILGASSNPDRYSYKAMKMLQDNCHCVTLVSPRVDEVEGKKVFDSLSEIEGDVDTLAMYVNPVLGETLVEEIIELRPKRVIFNPGTESAVIEISLFQNDIKFEKACTLVLLTTGQF